MTGVCQVRFTSSSAEEARRLGVMAVERRLAACAQVSGPISSTYRWRGVIETAEEWECTLKTTSRLAGDLTDALREAHSYEVPEIVAIQIEDGNDAYLEWIVDETGPAV